MSQTERDGVLNETWQITFRHSAGRLVSHALKALRDERRILGWRSGPDAVVLYPPKDLGGEGQWVELGPGAELLSPAPATGSGALARVRLDGASCGMFATIAAPAGLPSGARLTAHISDAGDLSFQPETAR